MTHSIRLFIAALTTARRAAACAGIAAIALNAAAASAEPPIWLIEDEDSTLYLFGTVHLLDPDTEWRTERVEQALDAATALWMEVALPATMAELQAQVQPAMLRYALSPDEPLSSLLSNDEQAQLARAVARTENPEQMAVALENTKPWFATMVLGVSPMLGMGYEAEAGADIILSRLAREEGDAVLGFETLDQQMELLSAGSEQEQLAALRSLLVVTDEQFDARLAQADAAYRAWMNGETAPLEALMRAWKAGEDVITSAGFDYDVAVAGRNEDWADQIETLLAGDGVAFIAVGAGHLVGPDSVQARLAERGIRSERYE